MSFCYWSVADGDHAKMMAVCIATARAHGVQEDFHVFTDVEIPGAICHKAGKFDKDHYLFKLEFLLKMREFKGKYEFFVFLDADNVFVRNPGDLFPLVQGNNWFVQMENQTNCPLNHHDRKDWWGCELRYFAPLVRSFGVTSKKIWNTNAGFWIVRSESVTEFYDKAMAFFTYCRNELKLVNFTEEPAIAYVGHLVFDPELNTLKNTSQYWACDWTGNYQDRIPNGEAWAYENYFSGEKRRVNPAIVHAMRSKKAMMALYDKSNPALVPIA